MNMIKGREDLEKLFPDSDEEWEKMMKGMTDDELVVYLRNVYETITKDPESAAVVPPDVLEQIRTGADKFEVSIRRAKIAEQNSAIANAELARTADALLAALPESKKKGH